MKSIFDNFNHFLSLQKGEKLAEKLLQFAAAKNINGAWVSGIGGAQQATIGYYNLKTKSYTWRELTDLHEVLSLQGNIALGEDGKPMFHLHGTFADQNFNTVGGHVKDLTVGATLELFIHNSDDLPFKRKTDQDTGLPLLDFAHVDA